MIKLISSVIAGIIVYFIVVAIIGNNALGKLFGIIGAVASFCGYVLLVQWADYNAPFALGIIIIFGPIALCVLTLLIGHILGGDK